MGVSSGKKPIDPKHWSDHFRFSGHPSSPKISGTSGESSIKWYMIPDLEALASIVSQVKLPFGPPSLQGWEVCTSNWLVKNFQGGISRVMVFPWVENAWSFKKSPTNGPTFHGPRKKTPTGPKRWHLPPWWPQTFGPVEDQRCNDHGHHLRFPRGEIGPGWEKIGWRLPMPKKVGDRFTGPY